MTDNKRKPIVFNEEKVTELIIDIFGLAAMLGAKAHEKDDDRREDLGNLLTIMSSLLMKELKLDPNMVRTITRNRQEMLKDLFSMVNDSPENDKDFKSFMNNNPLN